MEVRGVIANTGVGGGKGGVITGTLSLAGQSGAATFPKQMSMVIVSWSSLSLPSIAGTALLAPGSRVSANVSGNFAGNIAFNGTELTVSNLHSGSYLYNYVAFE